MFTVRNMSGLRFAEASHKLVAHLVKLRTVRNVQITGCWNAIEPELCQKFALTENNFIVYFVSIRKTFLKSPDTKCKMLTTCYVLPKKLDLKEIYSRKYTCLWLFRTNNSVEISVWKNFQQVPSLVSKILRWEHPARSWHISRA